MRVPTDTRVPEVLNALHVLLQQQLPDVQVIYGPTRNEDIADDVIWVAPGNENEPGVNVNYVAGDRRGLAVSYVEYARVIVNVLTSRGDGEMQPRVEFARSVLAAVRDMLVGNPNLSVDGTAACDLARFGDQMFWHPVQHNNGATVGLGFEIVAETNV